jgi:hypothetical protein
MVNIVNEFAGDRTCQTARLAVGNAAEWNQQSERRNLPGNTAHAIGQRSPDDDMALFWSGDNKLVVTQYPMNTEHVADCSTILDYKNVTCVTPESAARSHSICTDIAADERSLLELAEYIDRFRDRPVLIESYGSTPEYARLVSALSGRIHGALDDCMTPGQNLEYITYLDSKVCVREVFAAAVPVASQVRITRAFTARAGSDLLEHVKGALLFLGPVMVKADYGFGGHAMTLVEDVDSLHGQISGFLPRRNDFDIIIEEYVGSGDSVIPICYTGVVGPRREIVNSSVGRELQYSIRYYAGAHIGNGSVPSEFVDNALRAGEAVGKVIACFGYRGSFTLDLLCRKNDASIFLLEINPRRALPSTLGDMCLQLFGPGYEKAVSAIARRWIPVHQSITEYRRMRDFLVAKGRFGRQVKDLVILPYAISSLPISSSIGLAIMGTDNEAIEEALTEITRYLAEGTELRL